VASVKVLHAFIVLFRFSSSLKSRQPRKYSSGPRAGKSTQIFLNSSWIGEWKEFHSPTLQIWDDDEAVDVMFVQTITL
jgi:hypothetical protein